MRTNNGKVKNVILSIYFILIILAIIITSLIGTFSELYQDTTYMFMAIPLVFTLLIFITHYISKYFEYDSDGLQVVIINRGLLISEKFNYREHRLEFEKTKLKAYKINNYILYITLTLILEGSHGRKKETFNITLVSKKKRRYIRQSLGKIIKHNKNQKS